MTREACKRGIGATWLFAFVLCWGAGSASARPTAGSTIRAFYGKYVASLKARSGGQAGTRAKAPRLPFSKGFRELERRDTETCREKARDEVCGWDADGDVYLDSQEYDPGLTLESSGFKLREDKPGVVDVELNVYPSEKDAAAYLRKIRFLMVLEKGRWVVDDIVYDAKAGRSARQEMEQEIRSFQGR